jgi:Mg-chelatase subunit ChlD
VALLLDTSSSMEGAKIEAAKAAARAFVDALRLPVDQAAIITFDSGARIDHALTADRAALQRAIEGVRTRLGTRIDLGLWAGLEEVVERGRSGADPVIVLLTDGRPQGGSEGATFAAATFARDVRVDVWAIGLGPDVSEEVLVAIAGGSERVRLAPGPEELVEVYSNIAREIPCR